MSNALQQFRPIAFAEGVSFIVLLFIAMPLKYIFGMPEATTVVGWIHGVLFILYIVAGARAAGDEGWSTRMMAGAFIASLLPGGTFVLDRHLQNETPEVDET